MTAPLDLDGLEQKAKALIAENGSVYNNGKAAMEFADSANPATVLALIARVRELEHSLDCQRACTTAENHFKTEAEGQRDNLSVQLADMTNEWVLADHEATCLEKKCDSAREKLKIAEEALGKISGYLEVAGPQGPWPVICANSKRLAIEALAAMSVIRGRG